MCVKNLLNLIALMYSSSWASDTSVVLKLIYHSHDIIILVRYKFVNQQIINSIRNLKQLLVFFINKVNPV